MNAEYGRTIGDGIATIGGDLVLISVWIFLGLLALSMRKAAEQEEDETYRRQYRISNIPMRKRGAR